MNGFNSSPREEQSPQESDMSAAWSSLIDDVPFAGDQNMAASPEAKTSPELNALKTFLDTDLSIKRELIDLAPNERDLADEESRIKYVDNAYKAYRGLRRDFAVLENAFGHHDEQQLLPETEEFFTSGEESFALGRYDVDSVRRLYNKQFAELRPDYVEKVKQESCGYKLFSNMPALYQEATSINELLHAHHAAVLNNDYILQSIPEVANRPIANGSYAVSLRGENTSLGRDIFEAFTEDFDAGTTDIVALNNQVLMMVRDRGHALTLDIDHDARDADKVWVRYHIPKICNILMVEALPGVGKITEAGADGCFLIDRKEAGAKIVEFINQVPTDSDMSKPGGLTYRPE